MSDEFEQRVIAIIARDRGCKPDRINPTARLYHDLGIAGDDGYDLLLKLEKDFGFDLSTIDWSMNFGGEPTLFSVFRPIAFWKKQEELEPLTVAQLIDAVRAGKLVTGAEPTKRS